MLTLPPSVRIYLATTPVDGRRGIDSLAGTVLSTLSLEPLSGHVFCFVSKRRHQIKILFWDRTGFVLITKRLERGCFRLPTDVAPEATHLDLESPELTLILEGIDLHRSRRRPRWTPPAAALPTPEILT